MGRVLAGAAKRIGGMTADMNVVSIMAHQDDEMRCLGTMLKCRARGDRLFFVAVTDGSAGVLRQPPLPREEAAAIRSGELSALAGRLGAETLCLGERDEFLYDTPELRLRLIEAIRRTGAELIFTHYADDYNLDHTTTHALVKHCALLASLPLLPGQWPPLKSHPAVFCVQPHGPIPFPATHFVDITALEAQKIELLKNHSSQEQAMQLAVGAGFDKLCNRPDAFWGEQALCEYAEAFVPMQARGAIKPYPVLP
ncbi:MAG: PIG-L family deacetylase [Lentisphaerae bacterium]|nr:PIG-L family deacetylase [Lentisphaerota bacterium]